MKKPFSNRAKIVYDCVLHYWRCLLARLLYNDFVSNLRFTSYFNFSFNFFLSICRLLVFGFLQVKSRFWTSFSVNYCFFAQQPRIRVFKPGFKIQVSNFQFSTQTNISFSRSDLKMAISRFILKSPFSESTVPKYWWIPPLCKCWYVLLR